VTDRDGWLERFAVADRSSPAVYWLSVACTIAGTVGILWSLPVPAEFREISPLFNWGSAFLMVAAVYYFIISLSLAIGLLPFLVGLAAFELWLADTSAASLRISLALFAIGVGGLWFGHRGRGGIAAVIGDVQYIMLAPAWLLSLLYRWLGIPI
jgi:hypothetical protein